MHYHAPHLHQQYRQSRLPLRVYSAGWLRRCAADRATFMLCLDCGAEMRLVEVVEDTTMLVSGYEHQTWQCSDCSSIEQGMTFTRKRSPTPSVTVEHARTMLAKPAQTTCFRTLRLQPRLND